MSNLNNTGSSLNGPILTELETKVIAQKLIETLNKDPLFNFVNKVQVINGVMEVLSIGLITGESLKFPITINDFNPERPEVSSSIMKVDNTLYYSLPMDFIRGRYSTVFANEQMKAKFFKKMVYVMYQSLKKDLFEMIIKTYLTKKIPIDGQALAGGVAVPKQKDIEFDGKLTLGAFNTETLVLDGLQKIQNKLDSFKTLSLEHTAFSRKDKTKQFYGNWDPSQFILILNTPFKNQIRRHTVNIFQQYKTLLDTIPQVDIDFSLVENHKVLAGDLNKKIGFLVHKDALVMLTHVDQINAQLSTIKFQKIAELAFDYGICRVPQYPMIEIITAN